MSPRNHFSKHGGPYFINDGITKHDDPMPRPKKRGLLNRITKHFKKSRDPKKQLPL